ARSHARTLARGLDRLLAVCEPPRWMHRRLAAAIVGRAAVLALERELLVLDDFLRRHELAAREPRGPLERRRAAEVPDALQVRTAAGRPRRRPLRLLRG